MFDYIKDKEFLKKLRTTCGDIVNRLVMAINNDEIMKVHCGLVGSGKRNLITQNANEQVDLDYNLWIDEIYAYDINDGKSIKEYVKKMFDTILQKCGLNNCNVQDSKSALTTGKLQFKNGNKTEFSIDLAITTKDEGRWYRLIHKKTGYFATDEWFWNEGPHSKDLDEKVKKIKSRTQLWNEVRKRYIDKKNDYLKKGDNDHPSCVCYIEAVNEVYDKHFGQ